MRRKWRLAQVNSVISTAAMIPFRAKAVKKVLVEALFAPLTSDLGGVERLREKKEEKTRHTFGIVGVMVEKE